MSRNLLLVLLLAAGVVLADDEPESEQVATTTEAQKEAGQARNEEAQEQKDEGKDRSEEARDQKDKTKERSGEGAKQISGMSILGNREAPKSLVIVPWKSSELGKELGISTMLDDSRQPVDREVFMRELIYYEIRSKERP